MAEAVASSSNVSEYWHVLRRRKKVSLVAVLGVVAVGGMATSTFLTLFVIPVIYTLLTDLSTFQARFKMIRRKKWSPSPEIPDPKSGKSAVCP